MDNQDYESSITDEKDGKDLVESNPLPDWLKMRPEMIYDSSCIERGKELGHGHFGAVYEGTIRFGNAMWVYDELLKITRLLNYILIALHR